MELANFNLCSRKCLVLLSLISTLMLCNGRRQDAMYAVRKTLADFLVQEAVQHIEDLKVKEIAYEVCTRIRHLHICSI